MAAITVQNPVARTVEHSVKTRSSVALTVAVVGWCRGAWHRQPGDLATAVDAALAADWPGPTSAASLDPLPAGDPAPGVRPLRERLAGLLSGQEGR